MSKTTNLFTQWYNKPIVRSLNNVTGLIWGDDSGYRDVKTLAVNNAPLVVPSVELRPAYDGISPYTGKPGYEKMLMPGGLGKVVLREAAAKSVNYFDCVLRQISDGWLRGAILDAFRSRDRQARGFAGLLKYHMEKLGLAVDQIEDRVGDFLTAAQRANGTFCYVSAIATSPECEALEAELRRDGKFTRRLMDASAVRQKTVADDLALFITACANANIGRAEGKNIPLNYDGNAHAGGGAVDLMVIDNKGTLKNFTPFDYPEVEARMGYMEDDANFGKLAESWKNPMFAEHMLELGYKTPESFSWEAWKEFRGIQRVLYWLTFALGWTHWSEAEYGENWHFEPGNRTLDVHTGDVVCEESTYEKYPNSGNCGHTIQVLGPKATAVWGGKSAHKQLGLA